MAFNERFIKTRTQGTTAIKQIWIDRTSGVNYLFSIYSGYSGGLTVLVDSDGNPVVTPPEVMEKLIHIYE